jgi:hypothetical protein
MLARAAYLGKNCAVLAASISPTTPLCASHDVIDESDGLLAFGKSAFFAARRKDEPRRSQTPQQGWRAALSLRGSVFRPGEHSCKHELRA